MLGFVKRLLGGNVSAHCERKEKMRRINTEFDIRMRELADDKRMQMTLLVSQLDKQLSELKAYHIREVLKLKAEKNEINNKRSGMLMDIRESEELSVSDKLERIRAVHIGYGENMNNLRIRQVELVEDYQRKRYAIRAKYNKQRLRLNEEYNKRRAKVETDKVKQMSEI